MKQQLLVLCCLISAAFAQPQQAVLVALDDCATDCTTEIDECESDAASQCGSTWAEFETDEYVSLENFMVAAEDYCNRTNTSSGKIYDYCDSATDSVFACLESSDCWDPVTTTPYSNDCIQYAYWTANLTIYSDTDDTITQDDLCDEPWGQLFATEFPNVVVEIVLPNACNNNNGGEGGEGGESTTSDNRRRLQQGGEGSEGGEGGEGGESGGTADTAAIDLEVTLKFRTEESYTDISGSYETIQSILNNFVNSVELTILCQETWCCVDDGVCTTEYNTEECTEVDLDPGTDIDGVLRLTTTIAFITVFVAFFRN